MKTRKLRSSKTLKTWKIERSAVSGRFLKRGTAARHPRTTIMQRVRG